AVGRAVVDQDYLLEDPHRYDPREERPQRTRLVVDGDQHGEARARPHRRPILANRGLGLKSRRLAAGRRRRRDLATRPGPRAAPGRVRTGPAAACATPSTPSAASL